MEIIVYKSKKILEIWENGKLTHSYPVAIGKNEDGHKVEEGDLRTPEGNYYVCVKNPNSKYFLSLGLNYPNNEDAKAGLEKGVLSEKEFVEICTANDQLKIPLWKTKLGGEIFIHGELEKKNWSEGCVRLYNKDMEVLFKMAKKGTKVSIRS